MSRQYLFPPKFFRKYAILIFTSAVIFSACHSAKRTAQIDYLQPDATKDKPLTIQKKRTIGFENSGVWVSNQFAGGRLNDFTRVNDFVFTALIKPENAPVNNSAWYAFKIWGNSPKTVSVKLTYDDGDHRYHPKISGDGEHWQLLADQFYSEDTATGSATIRLNISPDTLWIAAQELFTSKDFEQRIAAFAEKPFVQKSVLGNSKRGKTIHKLEITEAENPSRYVAIISRQHPPEVTGTYALMAFLDALCDDSPLAQRFRREFSTIVIPLMNPDGVDNGHWRHNAGGIDLNRDWMYFNQPETRLASNEFLKIKNDPAKQLYFFLDFHSTQRDVFYTLDKNLETIPPQMTDTWLAEVQRRLPAYKVVERPYGTESPVSKSWFYITFQVPSITYEIGDDTPPETTRQVAGVAATVLMEQLLAYIEKN